MRRALLLTVMMLSLVAMGRTKAVRPVVMSRFRNELMTMTRVANRPSGFDELKQIELVTGVWTCKLELEGFLPTLVLDQYHPADRWLLKAEAVNAAATRNVRMLILKGLPGYKMQDSDTDRTVEVDKTRESRRVIFTKKDRFTVSTITVVFNAEQHGSVTMFVESWNS